MFLNSRDDFKKYLSKQKKPFMATYYKESRLKFDLLIENGNLSAANGALIKIIEKNSHKT